MKLNWKVLLCFIKITTHALPLERHFFFWKAKFNQIFHVHLPTLPYRVLHSALRKIPDSHSNDIFSLNKYYISLKSHTTHRFTINRNPYSFYWIEFQNCLHNYCLCIYNMNAAVTNVYLSLHTITTGFVQSKFYLMEFWVVVTPLTFYNENNWDVTNILYGVSAEKRKMWIISVNLLHNIQLRWTFAIKLKLFYILCERDYR